MARKRFGRASDARLIAATAAKAERGAAETDARVERRDAEIDAPAERRDPQTDARVERRDADTDAPAPRKSAGSRAPAARKSAAARQPSARRYHAPLRQAAAERTRAAILSAAQALFEEQGWARTTVPALADAAGVSPKTVEAQFRTKANLLAEVVTAIGRTQADVESSKAFNDAPTAISALPHHAAYATPLSARSARIARAVEEAAPTDPTVADIAERMRRNLDYGAQWAARILMAKRGLAGDLTVAQAERVFRFAIDPATYRTLTGELGLDDDGVREWMLRYERGMLLLRT